MLSIEPSQETCPTIGGYDRLLPRHVRVSYSQTNQMKLATTICQMFSYRSQFVVLILVTILAAPPAANAQRSAAENLLPKNTLAFVHVASVPTLIDGFKKTNIGRLIADPQVQPFVSKLQDATSKASQR